VIGSAFEPVDNSCSCDCEKCREKKQKPKKARPFGIGNLSVGKNLIVGNGIGFTGGINTMEIGGDFRVE